MHAFRRKLGLVSALSIVVFAGGCKGFFVNPTVSSLAVGPTATIQQTKTVQMIATATFSDGSTNTSPSGLFWSSSDQSVATVSSSGLVKGVSEGSATITAAVGSVTGTATITVTLGNITSITVESNPPGTTTVKSGDQLQLEALANTSNGQTNVPVTDSVTWNVNEGSLTNCCSINSTGLLQTTSGQTGQISVTATDPTSGTIGTLNITIN